MAIRLIFGNEILIVAHDGGKVNRKKVYGIPRK